MSTDRRSILKIAACAVAAPTSLISRPGKSLLAKDGIIRVTNVRLTFHTSSEEDFLGEFATKMNAIGWPDPPRDTQIEKVSWKQFLVPRRGTARRIEVDLTYRGSSFVDVSHLIGRFESVDIVREFTVDDPMPGFPKRITPAATK